MFFFTIISVFYIGLILTLWIGLFINGKDKKSSIKQGISIIIAARNEEKNLKTLFASLKQIKYPLEKFEIIIADDRSTDKTAEIIKESIDSLPNLKYVRIEKEYADFVGKKNALSQAIAHAENELLLFTDADCIPNENWLNCVNDAFQDDVDLIAGYSPLIASEKSDVYLKMKNLERASIFAVTAGSFGLNWGLTCTARNFGYRKSLYEKVGGYSGISHIRSGDDDLMLQKMSPYIREMKFMFSEDSFVLSVDKSNLKDQIHLETRRASKWKYYPISIKIMTLLIMIYYFVLIALIPLFFLRIISGSSFLLMVIAKIISEFLLVGGFLFRIKRTKLLSYFIIAEIFYIPYFIYFGLKGTFGKYNWKN